MYIAVLHCSVVYLCDDGKDPQKRKWCQRMGAGVEYVSGRLRAKGEMNGKSANLNNCLTQIYPEGTVIPHNELVSLFTIVGHTYQLHQISS